MLSSPSSGVNSGAKKLFAISFERSEQRSEEASLSRYFLGSTRSRAKKPFHVSFSSSSLLFSFSLSRSLSLFSGEGEWESPFSSLRLSFRVEHREESGGGERGHITEGNQNSSRGQKKNPEIIKKNRNLKQEGWRIADFFSHHPEAMHMFTFLMDDVGIPLNYRHMEGFGVHTYTLMTRDGKVRLRVFPLFFVFCLLSSGREGRERRTKPFALVLVFSLFPSFFLLSLYFSLLRRELQKTREEREASEREREKQPPSPPRAGSSASGSSPLSFASPSLPPSLPPQQQRQKNSLHRRPTSSSTGSPPAASSASSTPRPSASAAPTTRTRRRTSSSRSPRGTTPSGSS